MSMENSRLRYRMLVYVCVLAVLVLTVVGYYQLQEYETSILSVYASQQDAYVQLVLDQINLQKNRSDEEIVSDILGSLDHSGKRYWTLTKNQALLFVKDVTETNRYKGFTTGTYYATDSANSFYNHLTTNHVMHEIIEVDADRYVASGVVFEYGGAEYKICLLTNETVILDNNDLLLSKISIYIFMAVVLICLLLVALIFATQIARANAANDRLTKQVEDQYRKIDDLEDTIRSYSYYHTRHNLFHEALVPVFLKKLQKKHVARVAFVALHFKSEGLYKRYLEQAQLLLDKKVIRFTDDGWQLTLVFVGYTAEQAVEACNRIVIENEIRLVSEYIAGPEADLQDTYRLFAEAVKQQGGQEDERK